MVWSGTLSHQLVARFPSTDLREIRYATLVMRAAILPKEDLSALDPHPRPVSNITHTPPFFDHFM